MVKAKKQNKNGKKTNGNGNGNGNMPKPRRSARLAGRSMPRNPLLPTGVSNQATMPQAAQTYTVSAEEVIRVVNVNPGSITGQIVFNELITPSSAIRLAGLSNLWQRIKWLKLHLRLVALNGSLVTSGYTMGFLEDPEIGVPTAPSEVIPFLTAMRSTTVRQNWVESTSGTILSVAELPEMYTQQGLDIRRYSPGRLVVAVAGDVTSNTTFQIMMNYTVCLKLPFVAPTINPLDSYQFTSNLVGGISDGGALETPLPPVSTSPLLPAGRWILNRIAATRPVFAMTGARLALDEDNNITSLTQINIIGLLSTGLEASWQDYRLILTDGTDIPMPLLNVPEDPSETVFYWQPNQFLLGDANIARTNIFNRDDILFNVPL